MSSFASEKLSSGSFGIVYSRLWNKEGQDPKNCAIKISSASEIAKKFILNADFSLRYLHRDARASSFIVERFSLEKVSVCQVGLVSELLETDMESYLKSHPGGFSLGRTTELVKPVVGALEFCKSKGLICYSLTPGNILVSSDGQIVKLGNFEQFHLNEEVYKPSRGSLNLTYRSPESILKSSMTSTSNAVWALALIIINLFTDKIRGEIQSKEETVAFHEFLLQRPYLQDLVSKSPRPQIVKNSRSVRVNFAEPLVPMIQRTSSEKSEEIGKRDLLIDLLGKMLSYNVLTRSTFREILDHPLFREIVLKNAVIEEFINTPREKEPALCGETSTGELLGSGQYGDVFEGTITNNGVIQRYAFKISKEDEPRDDFFKASILQEDKMLRLLDDPNIIKRFAITKVNRSKRIALILERMKMNLKQYIKISKGGLPLIKTAKFTKQLASGLVALFKANIIHLDIKPENILVSDDEETVKITDLGAACFTDSGTLPNVFYKQSRWWRAPELLLEKSITPACDVWGLGSVAAEMHVGAPVFQADSEIDLIGFQQARRKRKYLGDLVSKVPLSGWIKFQLASKRVFNIISLSEMTSEASIRRNEDKNLTGLLDAFLDKTLEFDPGRRSTAEESLEDPFVQQGS